MLTSVRHAGVVVRDLDVSLSFYRDLLGLEVERELEESGAFVETVLGLPGVRVQTVKLRAPRGDTLVELLCFASPAPELAPPVLTRIGPTHIAFTVDDLSALHDALVAAGVEFISDPQVSADGQARVAFCLDPDGTPLELVEQIG